MRLGFWQHGKALHVEAERERSAAQARLKTDIDGATAAMAKAHLCDVYTRTTRAAIAAQVAIARERGWLDAEEDWLRPTELGRRFANDAIGLFLD